MHTRSIPSYTHAFSLTFLRWTSTAIESQVDIDCDRLAPIPWSHHGVIFDPHKQGTCPSVPLAVIGSTTRLLSGAGADLILAELPTRALDAKRRVQRRVSISSSAARALTTFTLTGDVVSAPWGDQECTLCYGPAA